MLRDEQRHHVGRTILRLALIVGSGLTACASTQSPDAALSISLGPQQQVVPGEGLPDEILIQEANNNLDIVEHQGRVYFAFRTAPEHFASDQTELHIVSSMNQETWTHEVSFSQGTDLREPRFLSLGDRLFLYFAVLGDNPLAFEPQGSRVSVLEEGSWSEAAEVFDADFIPWRARVVDHIPMLMGYTGGGEIYDLDGELPQIEVKWLTTTDGLEWEALVSGQETVHTGGGSETDWAFTRDGAVIAVMRNEAGDADGWGSKICRGEASDLASWTCAIDPRKFDSPLLFTHADRVWLIARRNLTETGAYDLEMRDLEHRDQTTAYSLDYWQHPKRCSLWEVDSDELVVDWVLDLPSRGDTCFASILPAGEDRYTVYNYSSDPEGDDISWLTGQTQPTQIYAQDLIFDSPSFP
jgi:hypothetical protein